MNSSSNSSGDTLSQATLPTVVVGGSLHLDVVVDAPGLPRIDETMVGSNVNYVCGGKGGNQAIAAALNGAPTAFIGCVGDDEFGNTLVQNLQDNNIDCSALQHIKGASGMSVAIVNSNGDYGAVIVSASNLHINSSSITLPESIGMLLLQNEIPEHINIELAQQASKLNKPVMLNAAPYRNIPTKLEQLIDILILNRVEAEEFFNMPLNNTEKVALALQNAESTISTFIVTLGEDGLVYRDQSGQVKIKPAYVINVSSTHGAGDMFCGALASRLVAGVNTSAALDYAMAAAAWHVSTSLADRSTIDTRAINNMLTGKT